MYNNKIARFVEDINVKHGISLNYTQKFQKYITGQKHFKYQLNPSNQPEPQQTQVPTVPATEQHIHEPHHHHHHSITSHHH